MTIAHHRAAIGGCRTATASSSAAGFGGVAIINSTAGPTTILRVRRCYIVSGFVRYHHHCPRIGRKILVRIAYIAVCMAIIYIAAERI